MPAVAPAEAADATGETGAADVTPAPEGALARAQASLAANDADIARLVEQRNRLLLQDEVDEDEVGRIDDELARHQRRQRIMSDRLVLLAAEAQRAAAEQRAAQKAETIAGIEALLAERDRLGSALTDAITAADAAFQGLFEIGHEVRRRWPFAAHDLAAMMVADGPLALAVQFEIFRLAGRPHLPGAPVGDHKPPSFPGGRAERLEYALQPEKIEPLAKRLGAGSAVASRVMREGFSTNQLDPAQANPGVAGQSGAPVNTTTMSSAAPQSSAPNPELAQVLARMNALASRQMTPDDEAEYQLLGRKCQELSAA